MQPIKLLKYQSEGIDQIVNRFGHVLLADHPGAGKTCQAIMAATALGAKSILVICPASLRENWKREFKMWVGDEYQIKCVYGVNDLLNFPLERGSFALIASYELATNYREKIISYFKDKIDLLILDEAHYVKNKQSLRTKAILGEIFPIAKKVIAITGTPMPNGAAYEAWPLFAKLCPKEFGAYRKFIDDYCVKEVTPWGVKYTKSKNLGVLGEKARANFMIRRPRAETVGQLPDLLRMTIPIEHNPYLVQRLAAEFDGAVDWIDNGPPNPTAVATVRRTLGLAKVPGAYKYIYELLRECPHLVVFAHHREVLSQLSDGFDTGKITHRIIHGDTSMSDRQKAVDDFQNGKFQVFLASLTACNTGITLTKARDICFVEIDWVPEQNAQAEARVHRVTQTDVTRSHYLICVDSLDDRITSAILRKQRNINEVMSECKTC